MASNDRTFASIPASSTCTASSALTVSGFSQNTCLPACAAAAICSAWNLCCVHNRTASTSGLSRASVIESVVGTPRSLALAGWVNPEYDGDVGGAAPKIADQLLAPPSSPTTAALITQTVKLRFVRHPVPYAVMFERRRCRVRESRSPAADGSVVPSRLTATPSS